MPGCPQAKIEKRVIHCPVAGICADKAAATNADIRCVYRPVEENPKTPAAPPLQRVPVDQPF